MGISSVGTNRHPYRDAVNICMDPDAPVLFGQHNKPLPDRVYSRGASLSVVLFAWGGRAHRAPTLERLAGRTWGPPHHQRFRFGVRRRRGGGGAGLAPPREGRAAAPRRASPCAGALVG